MAVFLVCENGGTFETRLSQLSRGNINIQQQTEQQTYSAAKRESTVYLPPDITLQLS